MSLFMCVNSLECAALSALWYAAAWRRDRLKKVSKSRKAATIQSADKAAHSKERPVPKPWIIQL
jgi:hypothetical protein